VTRRSVIYGFRRAAPAEVRPLVERALELRLAERDSSYRGVYYRHKDAEREATLYENALDDGSWRRPRFAGYRTLLVLTGVGDLDAWGRRLTEGRDEPARLHAVEHRSEDDEADAD
jgi:hypothetical protein